MVDIAAVKEFIQHPEYVCFIERLQKEGELSMNEHLPSFTILNYSANTINKSKVCGVLKKVDSGTGKLGYGFTDSVH